MSRKRLRLFHATAFMLCIVRVMNLASKAQFKAPASYLSLHHPTDNGLEAEALRSVGKRDPR